MDQIEPRFTAPRRVWGGYGTRRGRPRRVGVGTFIVAGACAGGVILSIQHPTCSTLHRRRLPILMGVGISPRASKTSIWDLLTPKSLPSARISKSGSIHRIVHTSPETISSTSSLRTIMGQFWDSHLGAIHGTTVGQYHLKRARPCWTRLDDLGH